MRISEGNNSTETLDVRIATRLKALRSAQGWSLDELAERCGISRASLSRLEHGDVSPTASVLGKLCAAYGLTVSRLMMSAESEFARHVPFALQETWQDPETGLRRTSVSPPSEALAGELLRCELPPSQSISYPVPPRLGLEHHLYVLDGALRMTIDGLAYDLRQGDCLRYQLVGPSMFQTGPASGATYILAVV